MLGLYVTVITTLVIIAACLLTARIVTVLPPRRHATSRKHVKDHSIPHLLIVLGSGGHTAEMLSMLERATSSQSSPTDTQSPQTAPRRLDWSSVKHRTWVISSGDSFSALRASDFERERSHTISDNYSICTVSRARKIYQSLLTTPISSLACLYHCLSLLARNPHGYPDMILANGPATATILIFASVLLRLVDYRGAHSRGGMRVIYVESWARVKRLSLSGRLLCKLADRILVQWEQLDGAQGKAEYHGVLI